MNFEIKNNAIKEKYFNSYVVECEAMYGDADGYGTIEVGGFIKGEDEEFLKEFVKFCKRMQEAYPNGRGGLDTYNHIEGFSKWFDCESLSQEEYDSLPQKVKDLTTDWLCDPQSFGEYQASFEGYNIFYYNENGVKYNVKEVK